MSDTVTTHPEIPIAAAGRVAGRPARPVADADLFEAWQVLNGIHVGLADIGRYTDTPEGMRDAIVEYFSPEMWRRIGKARRALADYVGDEEAETLESGIPYWGRDVSGPESAPRDAAEQQLTHPQAE